LELALGSHHSTVSRVVYWSNIPAPYMVDRFNALARRRSIEFEAWFSARTEPDRSWKVDEPSWQFRHRYPPTVGHGISSVGLPTPLLRGNPPDVFVSLYAAPAFLLGWALARQRGARTAFWVQLTFDAWIRRRRWKEALKSRILPRADGILTDGEDGRAFARRYGAAADRIFHVPHVIDFERYACARGLSRTERHRLRQELGLRGTAFAYVGRLLKGKGLLVLLDAFAALQEADVGETSLLIVGDGEDEGLLRERCKEKDLVNVIFAGFHHDDTLPRLYAAADAFVFPTLGDTFGQVVLEAMACGLPIIATSASGEIRERVVDGINGFVIPPADSTQLLERMALVTRDHDLRYRMGQASVQKVAGQSPEIWADAFEHAIERILSMPRVKDVKLSRVNSHHEARSNGLR
jgi:glycosyltransferase involved in cell wall biosynthesis